MAENMELIVSDFEITKQITFNYEDLKKELTIRVKKYKDKIYNEETIKDAKSDRALLNKVSKAINDEKKRVKEKLLGPYVDFENKCKELMQIIDEASAGIDDQVKKIEECEKNEKLAQILMYWSENSGEFGVIIDIDKLIKKEWLNKSYSVNKVMQELDHIVTRTRTDFAILENTSNDKELVKRLKDYYLNNINSPSVLTLTMQEKQRIEEVNKKIKTLENSQNLTKDEVTIINSSQKITNSELIQLDFRVWVTKSQGLAIREFLINNKIKFGNIPKNEK